MRLSSLAFCALFLLEITACRPGIDPNVSSVKHEEGVTGPFVKNPELEFTKAPFYWQETSPSEYAQYTGAPGLFRFGESITAENTPAVQIIQDYIDAAHAYVTTKTNLAGQQNLAKPHLIIVPNKMINAFVTAVPLCIEIPLNVSFAKPDGAAVEKAHLDFMGVREELLQNPFSGAPNSCMKSGWEGQAEEFAAWFNAVKGPCQLKKTAKGFDLVNADGCDAGSIKSAKSLVFAVQTNQIYLSSALAATFSDPDQLAAILLHEMGHYYRAHAITAQVPLYNYFYEETVGLKAGKPIPVADNTVLTEESKKLTPETRLAFEQKLRSRRLSYYTIEQEADDLSLEFLNALGIDPKVAPKGMESFITGQDETDEDFLKDEGMTKAECLAANASEWKDAISGLGIDQRIPLMGLDDPHHGYCYRTFNFYREIATHAYRVPARQLPKPTAEQWEAFRAEVAKLKQYADLPEPQF